MCTLVFSVKSALFFVIFNVEKWDSDDRNKKSEESRETHSQAKRRRMLQFTAQDLEASLCREDLSSRFLKSHVSDTHIPFCSFLFVCFFFFFCLKSN